MTAHAIIRTSFATVLALALAAGCGKKPGAPAAGGRSGGPVPVNLGEAVTKDMPVDLRAIGNVESIATVDVKAQVGGELIAVNFREGQDVKRGDLLFTIQPTLYATQLAQAEANLARDRAQAENAAREADRNAELGTKGAISKEQLDQMRSTAEAAAATVKADEALVKIAGVRLGYTTIEAAIDGRTGALNVQAGNLIKDNADTPMTTIKQLAPIYVTFAVPEQNLADIRRGLAERKLPVSALDPKDGKPLGEGEVTFVANAVDSSTGTITLKATFPNDDRALWPGAFVDILVRLDTEPGVTVVPASAVTIGQKGPQVFVVKEDGSADLRNVTVGRTVGQESVIRKGVEPGEKVVTNGQLRLVPGSKVLPKPAAEPAAGGVASPVSGSPPSARIRAKLPVIA
jgi:membrane fusion protein, multidrug efflux system